MRFSLAWFRAHLGTGTARNAGGQMTDVIGGKILANLEVSEKESKDIFTVFPLQATFITNKSVGMFQML